MLNERKSIILKLIIEEFIDSVEPVGSKFLTSLPEFNCSSATIRNEMAALEEMGYLEKTHTSSGRIPSEKGYRYYVDSILKINQETEKKYLRVKEMKHDYLLGNDEIINQAIKYITELTNYTALVMGPSSNRSLVKKIELIKIAPNEAVIIIVTDSGNVQKKKLFLNGMNIKDMQVVINILNEMLINVPINSISEKLSNELAKKDLKEYLKYHRTLLEAFIKTFEKFTEEKYFMSGAYKLLYEPEFNDINKIRDFMEALDSKKIFDLIDRNSEGVTVKIGKENQMNFMENYAVISIPYQIPTGEVGTIAVLGPKRMNYRKVIPLLEYIANKMSEFDE